LQAHVGFGGDNRCLIPWIGVSDGSAILPAPGGSGQWRGDWLFFVFC
jgi:hypothetical protein